MKTINGDIYQSEYKTYKNKKSHFNNNQIINILNYISLIILGIIGLFLNTSHNYKLLYFTTISILSLFIFLFFNSEVSKINQYTNKNHLVSCIIYSVLLILVVSLLLPILHFIIFFIIIITLIHDILTKTIILIITNTILKSTVLLLTGIFFNNIDNIIFIILIYLGIINLTKLFYNINSDKS